MLAGRRRRLLHRRAGDGEHRHLPARRPATCEAVREITRALRHAADLRRGEDRHHRRLGRRHRRTSACSPTSSRWPSRIGGGLPLGAFGGTAGVHGPDHQRARSCTSAPTTATRSCMAAAKAVLAEVCTPEATQAADRPQPPLPRRLRRHHRRSPTCPPTPCSSAPRAASRGRPSRVRNYRDYKATDFDLAFAQWMLGHQPRRAAAAGPRRAVAHLGAAHRRRRRARRRRVPRASSTRSSLSAVSTPADASAALRRAARGPASPAPARQASPAPTSTTVTAISTGCWSWATSGTTASQGSLDERGHGAHRHEVAHRHEQHGRGEEAHADEPTAAARHGCSASPSRMSTIASEERACAT